MKLLNPVLGREVRERLRSGRSFVALTFFLALLTLLTWAVVAVVTAASNGFDGDITRATASGGTLLDALAIGMLVLMVFLLPGIAASSVSGERERQTLVPLQLSLLRPRSILIGKVLAAAAYALLLLVAAAPIFAASYVLGGVSIGPALRTMGALAVIATLIITIAVAWSTMVRRTAAAVVASYFTILVFCVAAPIAFVLTTTLIGSSDPNRPSDERFKPLLLANPLVAVALVQNPSGATENASGVFDDMSRTLRERFDQNGERLDDDVAGVPDWLVSMGSMSVVAAAAGAVGVRRLRTPTRTER